MSFKRGFVGAGVLLGAVAISSVDVAPAQAGSMILGNSGWRASWDSSFDRVDSTYVVLTLLAETGDTVVVQKGAVFADGPDAYGLISPVEINFEQIAAGAAANIVITSESVTNATGLDWGGFRFIIEDGSTNTSADTSFNLDRSFGTPPPFNVAPFQVVGIGGPTDQPQIIELGDGILANGEIWRPGVGPEGGELVIHAAPKVDGSQRFVFKEQPLPIPLPAAAWMGLSSLVAMGAFGGLKRLRRGN